MDLPHLGTDRPIPRGGFLDLRSIPLGPAQLSLLPPELMLGNLLIDRHGLTYPMFGGLLNLEPHKDGFSLLFNKPL